MLHQNKVLIFSAPSGAGKSTIINWLLKEIPTLEFSISATSRSPRGKEKDGVEYYFLSEEEFKKRVDNGDFLEWEEVYSGSCYGTLNSELYRIWDKGHIVVFDIDVQGALNIKKILGEKALSIFIMPPSIEELQRRLVGRATDTPEAIEKRIAKAKEEISFQPYFDATIVNDDLATALKEIQKIVSDFIRN